MIMKTHQSNYTRKQEDGRTQKKKKTIFCENLNRKLSLNTWVTLQLTERYLLCRICLTIKENWLRNRICSVSVLTWVQTEHGDKVQALSLQHTDSKSWVRTDQRTQEPHSSRSSYPKGSEPLTLTIVTPRQRSMLRRLELISVNPLRDEVALDKSSTPGILAYLWGWKHKLWSQTAWGRISALPPTSYVTLTSSLPHQHQTIKETELYRNDFQKVGDFFG